MRAAAEPEAEVRMRVFYLELLYQFVKLRHPAEGQVTVGQEHPVTLETRHQIHMSISTDLNIYFKLCIKNFNACLYF